MPIINLLGVIYPTLPREVREQGLRLTLRYLDGINYFYAQNHMELIEEPQLAADVLINKGLYSPGYGQYCEMLGQCKTWVDLQARLPQVQSAFWLAFAVCQPQYASDHIRGAFFAVYPTLIDHTQDAIAAFIADRAQRIKENEDVPIEQTYQAKLFKYDRSLHSGIRRKIEEEKWVKVV